MGSITTRTAAYLPLTAVALAAISLLGGNAYANECGAAYQPSQTQEATDYFYIDLTVPDDKTIDQVRDFAKLLKDGRWQGTGLDIRCSVSDDEPLTVINNYDVDAEIEKHFLGALIMRVQQESTDLVNLDTVWLSPDTELDSETQAQKVGHRNYSVDLSTPGTMVYNEKYRTFTPREDLIDPDAPRFDRFGKPLPFPHAVRLVHEIKTVSIEQASLTVHRDVYVNGKFSAQQEWQLQRL